MEETGDFAYVLEGDWIIFLSIINKQLFINQLNVRVLDVPALHHRFRVLLQQHQIVFLQATIPIILTLPLVLAQHEKLA